MRFSPSIVWGILLGLVGFSAQAQIDFAPLDYAPANRQSFHAQPYSARHYLKSSLALDTLGNLFTDDFSRLKQGLDLNLWMPGSGVLVNNDWGVDPPTVGVATFDGTDSTGNPYSLLRGRTGGCDTLMTRPLDLSLVPGPINNTVWLHFDWQNGGHDVQLEPDANDSLVLQFHAPNARPDSGWVTVWKKVGGPGQRFLFQAVNVPIFYQYNGFQFRFINYGNRNGMFDLWHIDQVSLAWGRNGFENANADLAFSLGKNRLFRQYYSIPWHHVSRYDTNALSDEISATLKSYNNSRVQPPNQVIVPFNVQARALDANFGNAPLGTFPQSVIRGADAPFFTDSVRTLSLPRSTFASLTPSTLTGPVAVDLKWELNFASIGNNYSPNDTVTTPIRLDYAYVADDGTAELTGGIGGNQGRLAMRYFIPFPDSISHVQFLFPRSLNTVPGVNFTVLVWRWLAGLGPANEPLRGRDSILLASTQVVNTAAFPNQIVEYALNRRQVVQGEFYVGYRQGVNPENYLRIGFDCHSNNNGNLFAAPTGVWQQYTAQPYTPIIRPVFRHGGVTGLNEREVPLIAIPELYPNPNGGSELRFSREVHDIRLVDLSGRQHISHSEATQQLDISALPSGLYLVSCRTPEGYVFHKRLVRQ